MTSIFGALLTAGYASAMGTAISDSGRNVTEATQNQLQLSFASATDLAKANPAQAGQIISAAQSSFLQGDKWAYTAALVAVAIGMAVVFFFYPNHEAELKLRASFAAEDGDAGQPGPSVRGSTARATGAAAAPP